MSSVAQELNVDSLKHVHEKLISSADEVEETSFGGAPSDAASSPTHQLTVDVNIHSNTGSSSPEIQSESPHSEESSMKASFDCGSPIVGERKSDPYLLNGSAGEESFYSRGDSSECDIASLCDDIEARSDLNPDEDPCDPDEANPIELEYGLLHAEIDESGTRRIIWETHNISLERMKGLGFGIAVSGGRGNPHFQNGDESIAISDVLQGGPADGKLRKNDRVIAINGLAMTDAVHSTAIEILRDSGNMVDLLIKRRVVMGKDGRRSIQLRRTNRRQGYGIVLGCQYYVKSISSGTPASYEGTLQEGDRIVKINNMYADGLTLPEIQKLMEKSDDLRMIVTPNPMGPSDLPNLYKSMESVYNWASQQPANCSSGYNSPDGETPWSPRSRTSSRADQVMPQATREVTFLKENGSHGLSLVGGNMTGIFISKVQQGGAAQSEGMREGDEILQINGISVKNQTREEVVNRLLSLPRIVELTIADGFEDYIKFFKNVQNQSGDSFYIRAMSSYNGKGSYPYLSVEAGDIYHVIDTLPDGLPGSWQVKKMNQFGSETTEGLIPSKTRYMKLIAGRSPLSPGKNTLPIGSKEDWQRMTVDAALTKMKQGFEKVTMKEAEFRRPVVIYGFLAELGYGKLASKYSAEIETLNHLKSNKKNIQISLDQIKAVIQSNRHCLLDVPPYITEKLVLAGLAPIVIHVDMKDKDSLKMDKVTQKKLRLSEHVKETYSHIIHHSLSITSDDNSPWLFRLYNLIKQEQATPCWLPEETKKTVSQHVARASLIGSQIDLRSLGRAYAGSLLSLAPSKYGSNLNLSSSPPGRQRSISQPKQPVSRPSSLTGLSARLRPPLPSPVKASPLLRQAAPTRELSRPSSLYHENQAFEEDEDIYAAVKMGKVIPSTRESSSELQKQGERKSTGVWYTESSKASSSRPRSGSLFTYEHDLTKNRLNNTRPRSGTIGADATRMQKVSTEPIRSPVSSMRPHSGGISGPMRRKPVSPLAYNGLRMGRRSSDGMVSLRSYRS